MPRPYITLERISFSQAPNPSGSPDPGMNRLQPLALRRGQRADAGSVAVAHRLERPGPEDLPDHGCVLQEALAIGCQVVEPR